MEHRIQVRPEDLYNEQTILAAQEGRLFIDLKTDTIDRETINNNVRAYVHRIDSLVTRRFSASIDALWDAIFRHDGLMAVMMPKPRARKCRDFDKYGVARIIGLLREKGVYEQYSDRHFDALLEPDVEESPYRRFLSQGFDNRSLVLAIRDIIANMNV
jgi:hypothetical protein